MKPRSKTGNNSKVYILLGAACLLSAAYIFYPSIGGNSNEQVLMQLIADNERLRGALESAPAAAAPVAAAAAPAPASCNCDTAERLREAAESDKRRLEAENRELHDKISELRAAAAATAAAAQSSNNNNNAVVASNIGTSASNTLPVPSCAHQKLEFLRWQTDENGVTKTCEFIPENYDNWQKMPPLCDYISIECLGAGNKRAAHVFGFGGPGLMIGYADVLTWEFVFARHQNLNHMVELGTMTGGTSLYWGMTANVRGGEFHSFDRSDNRASESRRGWLPNMKYHITDILTNVLPDDPSTHNQEVVKALDIGRPVLGLFDNGDKKKETDIYARYMAVGSVLLLHDWEHLDLPRPHWEMSYSMVKKTLDKLGFQPMYFDFCEHIGSSTRVFMRTSAGPL